MRRKPWNIHLPQVTDKFEQLMFYGAVSDDMELNSLQDRHKKNIRNYSCFKTCMVTSSQTIYLIIYFLVS